MCPLWHWVSTFISLWHFVSNDYFPCHPLLSVCLWEPVCPAAFGYESVGLLVFCWPVGHACGQWALVASRPGCCCWPVGLDVLVDEPVGSCLLYQPVIPVLVASRPCPSLPSGMVCKGPITTALSLRFLAIVSGCTMHICIFFHLLHPLCCLDLFHDIFSCSWLTKLVVLKLASSPTWYSSGIPQHCYSLL